jgi:hypothetical protein
MPPIFNALPGGIGNMNFMCIFYFSSVVFMFFASFVPAISFGGLMGEYTDEHMGVVETLFAQCICGIIWGIFSAQPLLISEFVFYSFNLN